MNKNLLYLFLIGLLAGSIVGYMQFNKPAIDMDKAKVDLSLSANKLLADYETDETAANSKYLDKVIAVKGVVSKVNESGEKKQIFLETDSGLSSVICQLDDTETTLPELGDHIKVKGICTGYLMDVVLIKSIIATDETK